MDAIHCHVASFWVGVLVVLPCARADHPTVVFGSEGAGPITTVTTSTLAADSWALGLRTEIVNFDRFSDAELEAAAAAGEDDVHSIDRLSNTSISLAYGMTDDLTLSARLPYVDRQNIREGELEDGEPESHDHGDSSGLGDLVVVGQYCVFAGRALQVSLLGGFKAPTGKTNVKDDGVRLETEFQPGTGSWDWLFGASASVSFGRLGWHGSVLHDLTTEGDQDTEIGDAIFYNLGVAYTLSNPNHLAHHTHQHSHVAWDLILELNGEVREKNSIDGQKESNSGGDRLYLSPGMRISPGETWSLFLSLGIPVYDDPNGTQTDVDYRVVGGIGFAL